MNTKTCSASTRPTWRKALLSIQNLAHMCCTDTWTSRTRSAVMQATSKTTWSILLVALYLYQMAPAMSQPSVISSLPSLCVKVLKGWRILAHSFVLSGSGPSGQPSFQPLPYIRLMERCYRSCESANVWTSCRRSSSLCESSGMF